MANPWGDDDFSFDDENGEGKVREPKKDALIILIDSRSNMFETNSAGEVYFHNAINVAVHVLKNKVINSDKDLVGVFLYGTREKKNANEFDGIYEFQDLDCPTAHRIKELESISKGEFDFEGEVGSVPFAEGAGESPLHHALWSAASAFAGARVATEDFQRIWLFTNDDNPNSGEKGAPLRTQAVQKARDCAEMNQMISLWSMNRGASPFSVRRFFLSLLAVDEEEEGGAEGAVVAAGAGNFDQLLDRVRRKEYKKRSQGRVPFIIDDATRFSVALYAMIHPAKVSSPQWLEAATNAPVSCLTKWLCLDTADHLLPHQIRTYHKLGSGDRVVFSKSDMEDIKGGFGSPSLRLMGFKPAKLLRERDTFNLRSPYFIYPDEGTTRGSTAAFAALHQQMVRKDVVAIVFIIPRARSTPKFAALVPQEEEVEESGVQVTPPGMHVVFLPFADDIRTLKFPPAPTASQEQVVAARQLVDCLNLPDFHPHNFENPKLQKHFASLQALALEEDDVDWHADTDDLLQPDLAGMAGFEPRMRAFAEATGADYGAPAAAASSGGKRSRASGGGGGAAAKRSKKAAGGGAAAAAGDDDWAALVESGQIKKKTVPMLKAYLKAQGMPVSGRKADLIARIAESLP